MTTSHLLEISAMITAGLRAQAKPEGEPCPEEPDIEWNSTVGRLEPEPVRCAWVCPVTCLDCTVKNCADRLAGGSDAI